LGHDPSSTELSDEPLKRSNWSLSNDEYGRALPMLLGLSADLALRMRNAPNAAVRD
jgi:hypothetical protein